MSWKPEEKHTRYSLDGIEIKLLVPGSKPRIHEVLLESTRGFLNPPEKTINTSLNFY